MKKVLKAAKVAASVMLAALLATTAVSCSGKDGKSGSKQVTIKYQLWDSNQLPAYQAAVEEFMKQNPNIKIEIT